MTNETITNNLVDTLRRLADVVERENLQLCFAVVKEDSEISITESNFRMLFKGKLLSGKRNGNWVDVSAEKFGIVFQSTVYSPVDRESGEVKIQL